ncbi:MAG: hypothetical protein J5I93_05315, partial [Pirellulaceae bacterium]|nr:hypothetical protein [Pirellulaceae bacterium]
MVSTPNSRPRRRAANPSIHKLNVPLLVGTLLAFSSLTVAAYFWHGFQLRRLASIFLDRAVELEQQDQWRAASGYIHRYLRLRPDDGQARIRLARAYDQSLAEGSDPTQAIDLYYRALGVAEAGEQAPLRHRLTELLLETGRFVEAESEALAMLATDAAHPFARRALAV